MEHFPHLNEFCAAGAAAAVRRRQERERREELMSRGVFSESAMFPEDGGVVEGVHILDVGWLEDEFIASLAAAEGAAPDGGDRGVVEEEAHGEGDVFEPQDGVHWSFDLEGAFDEILGDLGLEVAASEVSHATVELGG